MKIPVLLYTTAHTLVAFAEARTGNCSDFARTDIVYRRSDDDGITWSALKVLPSPSTGPGSQGLCGHPLVVGNAVPVQLPAQSLHPNRILVPHTRNNFEVYLTYSDDDALTWSAPRKLPNVTVVSPNGPDCSRNMSYFGVDNPSSVAQWIKDLGWGSFDPYTTWRTQLSGPWQFIGLGPPGSVVLREKPNRILVPGYHSFIRGLDDDGTGAGAGLPVSQLYNNFALGHVLISDDAGDSFRLGSAQGFGAPASGNGANEAQLVQLRNGSLLVNSRSLSTGSPQFRTQARSDDQGETFTPTDFIYDLPEPFNGCQGSFISDPTGTTLYLSHPNPQTNNGIAIGILNLLGASVNLTGRDHLTLWTSRDQGASYQIQALIDAGAAGYSSLQIARSNQMVSTQSTLKAPSSAADLAQDHGSDHGQSHDQPLWIFYEQSDPPANSLSQLTIGELLGSLGVLSPDRLVLRKLELP